MTHLRSVAVALAAVALFGCNKTTDAPPTPETAPPAEVASPAKAAPAPDPEAAFEARATSAIGALKKGLMGALQGAMKAGGPAKAVEACNLSAPGIAEAASTDGLRVGRTSARLRNPKNAPADWMKPLLAEYAALPPAEAKPRTIALPDGHFARVEPLYAGGLCLTCHGAADGIPPDVGAKLAALYPDDRATGYAAGAFRGLIWVTDGP